MKRRLIRKIQALAAVLAFVMLAALYAKYAAPPKTQTALSVFREGTPLSVDTIDGLSNRASGIVLYDALTDTVLYEKGGDLRLPMASTTKIMTAVVALENGRLDEMYTVPPEVCGIEGSSIYLRAGEVLSLRELLYGLLLESGNDAAEAIALCVGTTREGFIGMMNEKAAQLGLSSTHFDNPHGLSSETHYTTAKELAALTAYAMRSDFFREAVACKYYGIAEREHCAARYFSNHNRLLRTFPLCVGVKTGYTAASGRCLVTAAEQNGGRFIAVTLNDRLDFADHKILLQYAADSYRTICFADAGTLLYRAAPRTLIRNALFAKNAAPLYLTVPKEYDAPLSVKVTVRKSALLRGEQNAACAEIRMGEYAMRRELCAASGAEKGA